MSLTQSTLLPFVPGQPLMIAFDGAPANADTFQVQVTHTWSNGASTTDNWTVQGSIQDPNSKRITLVLASLPPTPPGASNTPPPGPVNPTPGGDGPTAMTPFDAGAIFVITSALYACIAEADNPAFCTEAGIGMTLVTGLQLCQQSMVLPITPPPVVTM